MVESRLGIATLVSGPRTIRGDPRPKSAPLLHPIRTVGARRPGWSWSTSADGVGGSGCAVAHALDALARCDTLSRVCVARADGDGHRLNRHSRRLACSPPARKHASAKSTGAGP